MSYKYSNHVLCNFYSVNLKKKKKKSKSSLIVVERFREKCKYISAYHVCILRNLHLTSDWHYIGQKLGEDFAKFCGHLRIYEL